MSNGNGNNNFGIFFLGFFIALGLIGSASYIGKTVKEVKLSNQTIKVKGYAERRISSDFAIWRARFSTRSFNLVEAYDLIEGDRIKVLSYLQKSGIPSSNIDISSVTTTIQYEITEKGYNTNRISGYTLEQYVTIVSNDVMLINKVSKASTTLIKDRIELTSFNPEYYYTNINDLKITMLGEASADARKRAIELAQNSGGNVGPLRAAAQGVFQITPVNSTEVSNYGRYDTSTIDKTIKAVVTIEYSIQ
ncbi:MAG: SIMPL domain-containing protein [Chlamydiota bacterium]|nr:SIMPL domain-containing protein [Chlamydiota bacterium]